MKELNNRALSMALTITMILCMMFILGGNVSTVKAESTNSLPTIAMPSDGASTTVPNISPAAPDQQNTDNGAAVSNDNNNETTTTEETINDENTPLSSKSKSEKIADNKTPKGVIKDTCYIHWIMIILTALFGIYNIVRVIKGNKEELEERTNR
mgnify:CR=1 FL=1